MKPRVLRILIAIMVIGTHHLRLSLFGAEI